MSTWIATSRGKTSEVTIFAQQGYVVKQFRTFNDRAKHENVIKGRGSLEQSYLRELESLKRLKGYPNFPQIIDHSDQELWIKMSYCGEPYPCKAPRKPRPDLLHDANQIVDTLGKVDVKYNYKAISNINGKKIKHLQASNVNLHGNTLYLIDFERALPVGCEHLLESAFVDQFKTAYTKQEFKLLFKELLVPTDDPANQQCFDWLGNKRHFKIKEKHR